MIYSRYTIVIVEYNILSSEPRGNAYCACQLRSIRVEDIFCWFGKSFVGRSARKNVRSVGCKASMLLWLYEHVVSAKRSVAANEKLRSFDAFYYYFSPSHRLPKNRSRAYVSVKLVLNSDGMIMGKKKKTDTQKSRTRFQKRGNRWNRLIAGNRRRAWDFETTRLRGQHLRAYVRVRTAVLMCLLRALSTRMLWSLGGTLLLRYYHVTARVPPLVKSVRIIAVK